MRPCAPDRTPESPAHICPTRTPRPRAAGRRSLRPDRRGRASGSRPCSSCCFLLYPSCVFCRKGKKTSLHPRKGTKARSSAIRLTTRYCVPTYAAFITAKLPSAPTVSRREGFGLQLRSDIRSRPTCTGLSPYPGSLRVRSSERTVSIIIFHALNCYIYCSG